MREAVAVHLQLMQFFISYPMTKGHPPFLAGLDAQSGCREAHSMNQECFKKSLRLARAGP